MITIAIRLRFDYDVSRVPVSFDMIRREQKMNMSIFRRGRIAVKSNAYRNFDHFGRSRMRHGIVFVIS